MSGGTRNTNTEPTVTGDNVTTAAAHMGSPWDDATWILTSSFIIFTMQSGFGLLESGMASRKNEVNIMIKNVVDVVFGGLTYWAAGYGLSFGKGPGTNAFNGVGFFFLDPSDENTGTEFSKFIFEASFATTATTIVSGAMAERSKLMAYVVFSLLNTFVYSFPAHWVWDENGWLKKMGVVDVAGVGPVHLVGGVTALIAAILLKPRKGRFDPDWISPASNPVNAVLGLFTLWWGWLGFNCGSTFGISGGKWKLAARAAAVTILASCGGGTTAFVLSYFVRNKKFEVPIIVNGILGALVSVTGLCALTTTWAALLIGSVGSVLAWASEVLLIKLEVDDPVGATSVHFACSVWGLLACGIFAKNDTIEFEFNNHNGLVWGGGFYLLGVQTLAVLAITAWSAAVSGIFLIIIQVTIGLRVSPEEEELGADYVEHNLPLPEGLFPRTASAVGNGKADRSATNSKKSKPEGQRSRRKKKHTIRRSWARSTCLCLCHSSEGTEEVASHGENNTAFEESESDRSLAWVIMMANAENGGVDRARRCTSLSALDVSPQSPSNRTHSQPHAESKQQCVETEGRF